MMATTELEKIPETVLSRSQVYELRAIGTKAIAEQLRRIVDAEQIAIDKDSLQLIARDADGSMRDAQSKLDQVIAFTGATIGADDVATVLGLVGRDLLLDTRAGGRRRRCGGGVRAGGARRRDWATTCGWSAASCRGWCATCWCCRSIRRASTIRRSPAKGSAIGCSALAAVLARRSAARLRPADEGGESTSAAPRSRAITSRWRCCAGSICGS